MKAAQQAARPTPRRRGGDDGGFMMVAVLVGLGIAAIWMTAALPSWRQQAQRQREEELIFRGEQYARAIVLFQNKYQGANPPDIDTLVSQHFLRKKWKDPVTGLDFIPVGLGIVSQPGQASPIGQQTGQQSSAPINTNGQPGVSGVRSASTATSIKVYQNQQQYSLWAFDAQLYRVAHGMQPAPGTQQGGGRQGGGRQGGDGRGGQGGGQGIGPGGGRGGAGQGRGGGGRGGDAGPGRGGGAAGGARGGRGGLN